MKPVHYAAMALLAVVQWAALPFAQAETEDPMLFYGPIETSFQLTELSTPTPGGQWVVTVIDDGGPNGDNVGEYASLAVPTAGPYAGRSAIGYYNRTRSDLKYAQRVSGWYTCFPDQEPSVDVGPATSLAFSPDLGWPWISYHDRTNLNLKVAYFDGGCWTTFVAWPDLIGPPYTGESTSLKFLPSGEYAVAFRGIVDSAGGLVYLNSNGVAHLADGESKAGYYCSLAIRASDQQPSIAYLGYASRLKYAWSDDDGRTWSKEVVHNTEGAGCWPSLAILPSSGQALIAYYPAQEGVLKFAWRVAPNSWSKVTVHGEPGAGVGRFPSLAIRGGQPVISYVMDGALMCAWHTGSDFSTGWQHSDPPVDIGAFAHTSLAILPGGAAAISYYDQTNGNLKYAVQSLAVAYPQD